MSNHKQLALAWLMYAGDNNDKIPYASTFSASKKGGGSTIIDPNNPTPSDYAWSGMHMDVLDAGNRAAWDQTYDLIKRPLWQYAKNIGIYKCPADHSTVTLNGVVHDRLLSMSMNLYVGGFAPETGYGSGTDGGYTDQDPYKIYGKTSEISPPSSIFLFLDMRADTVNWSNFMTDMKGYKENSPGSYAWYDIPGIYHNRCAGFSFVDGHSEIKKWLDGRTCPPLAPLNTELSEPNPWSQANNQDIAWMQDHATRPK
jgi:hypothetical protein